MSYASGGLIQATDYNSLAQTTIGGNIAYVWGTGSADWGYGQTTTQLATVSAAGVVTATQWAGLVYTLNRAIGHQWGTPNQLASGSNIGVTAGATIQYFSNVASMTSNIATNHLFYNSTGSTTTGSNFTSPVVITGSTSGGIVSVTRTVTFAGGADAVRYFFNAGGKLALVTTATDNAGTSRSQDFAALWNTYIGGSTVFATSSTARSGTGGTVVSSNATAGYYTLTTTETTLANVKSGSATYVYATYDWGWVSVKTNGTQGSNRDQGTTLTFTMYSQQGTNPGSDFNDNVNITLTSRVDITVPETTFLANTWGVIGVT